MLFQDYHIPLIRTGIKTVTRREWERRQVKPNGVYQATTELFVPDEDCECYIRVLDVYEQPLGHVTDADAKAEGDYDSVAEFIEAYEAIYGEWNPEKVVTVVPFEYVGRERP